LLHRSIYRNGFENPIAFGEATGSAGGRNPGLLFQKPFVIPSGALKQQQAARPAFGFIPFSHVDERMLGKCRPSSAPAQNLFEEFVQYSSRR
jgi:hypothetical protein